MSCKRKVGRDHAWRHSWCSHPLDGRHPTDYNRLDWSLSPSLPFHHSLGYAQHAGSFVLCRWHRPVEECWNQCHQELCMSSHRQLHSNILCSSTQFINLYTLLSTSSQGTRCGKMKYEKEQLSLLQPRSLKNELKPYLCSWTCSTGFTF